MLKGEGNMIIMASTLANAINECRHITPEELIQDNIHAEKEEKENETD